MNDTKTQARLRPVIRVFVSSTFRDMKHERNALEAEVFPKLEQLCQRQGFQFQAIDLRWGVSTEAGLDHRTMRICFEELRRAQEISPEPNFLVLLGDRYGWRPLPEAISRAEFAALATAASTGGENQAPLPGAHGKSALQVLEDWYRCDHNVVLPEQPEADPDRAPLNYLLQPRTQDLEDGRDYKHREDDPTKDTQDWMDVQKVLWRLINAAYPAEGRQWFNGVDWPKHVSDVNDPAHPKPAIPQITRFQASATEQEIWCGAFSAANAERHVIACFRKIANRNDFSAADAKDFFDVTDDGFDTVMAARQLDLKTAIEQRLGENKYLSIPFKSLKCENGRVFVDASKADTEAFCDAVFERFRPIIERQIEEYWNKSAKDSPARATRELKIEQDEHERFGRERGGKATFVGRDSELDAIRNYLSDESRSPLVVHGSSGCGKTALLWRAFEDIPKNRKPMIRLIGTTPHSSDVRGLLTNLCQELRQRNPRTDALPTEIKELRDEFSQHLQGATLEQPLILFLDALDQLADADNGRLLNWLPPDSLPPHVKLVVSCLSDRASGDPAGQPYAELKRRQIPAENFINLDVLPEAEARVLLFDRWLPKAGRKVSDEHRARIEQRLASPACRQPIFLKLLFEEVQLWHSYDPAPVPGESVPALLGQLFDRLSQPTNHGPLLVNRVLGYLSASRHGLAENEILEILFADPEYRTKLNEATEQTRHELPPNAKRIPIALWSRLRFDLAPYLTERAAPGANVLTFYHRQMAESVRGHFLDTPLKRLQRHERLAEYFHSQDYFLESLEEQRTRSKRLPPTPRPANVRKVDELPWQRLEAAKLSGKWDAVEELLTDLFFLEAKTEAGLVFDLTAELDEAVSLMPTGLSHHRILELLEEAIRRDIHFIARHPTTLFQCMWNTCWWYDCSEAAEHYQQTNPGKAAAGNRFQSVGMWLACLGCVIIGLLILWCGVTFVTSKVVWAAVVFFGGWFVLGGALGLYQLASAGRRSTSGFDDTPADTRNSSCRTLAGFMEEWRVSKRAITPRFVWLRSVRPPPVPLGSALQAVLYGHKTRVLRLKYFADGQCIVSGSQDGAVRVWEVATGKIRFSIDGMENSQAIIGVSNSSDGRFIAAGYQKDLRIWDASSGTEVGCFQTEHDMGNIAFSPDGRHLAACVGNDVRVWNVLDRSTAVSLSGHQNLVWDVAYSPDGLRLVTASYDKTIRVWDALSGLQLFSISGHKREVGAIAFSPDNRKIVSGSHDWTIRTWDANSGEQLNCVHGHEWVVTGVSFSPDGIRIVSSSLDGTVRIWDAASGKELSCLRVGAGPVQTVDYSPDRQRVATAGVDGVVRIWNSKDQSAPRLLQQHHGFITKLAFSPNGDFVVSGACNLIFDQDSTIRVWDTKSGLQHCCFEGPRDLLVNLRVSEDNNYICAEFESPFTWKLKGVKRMRGVSNSDSDAWVEQLQASCIGLETTVEMASTGLPIAWMVGNFTNACIDVSGRMLAASKFNSLFLFAIERL